MGAGFDEHAYLRSLVVSVEAEPATLVVEALGGTTFRATLDGKVLGKFEAGAVDADGQWDEGDDDLEDRARAAFDVPSDARFEG